MKHEIINNGKPNLKNMSKPEFNVFCKSILDIIIEEQKDKEKSPPEHSLLSIWNTVEKLLI